MEFQGGRRWRRAGGSLLWLPDPLLNQKVYVGFGRAAAGIHWTNTNHEREGRWNTRIRRVCAYQPCPIPTISLPHHQLIPLSAHAARSLFVVVMSLCQVPVVIAEVIKMKWAVDPMVPFRRVEHWPQDLYLIDQQFSEKKSSLPPERPLLHSIALVQRKMSLWKKSF